VPGAPSLVHEERLAHVDADARAQRDADVEPRQLLLEGEREEDRVRGDVEAGEEAVAGEVALDAVVLVKEAAEELVVARDGASAVEVAQALLQLGGADEVGEEEDLQEPEGFGGDGWTGHVHALPAGSASASVPRRRASSRVFDSAARISSQSMTCLSR